MVLIGCSGSGSVSSSDYKTDDNPDQELWNAKVVFSQNERKISVLHAPHIAIYERQGLTIVDSSFQLDIFNTDGGHSSVIFADSGVVFSEDSMQAFHNVRAISDSGMTLTTERLIWNRRWKTVKSDTFVTVTTATDTLYGDSLLSDERLENWEVFNPRGVTVREIEKPNQ